jgi:RimJ/RimL family protein N-acetyltransferase
MTTLAFATRHIARGPAPVASPIEAIDTRRLVLRPPAEEDIVAITALADNVRLAAKLPDMPNPYTISDAGRFIRRQRDRRSGLTAYVVTERDRGTLIGCCKIEAGETDNESRIGFWTGEPFWNRGYMTEAAQALIDHAFTHSQHLARIGARVGVVNPAPRRVLEKCGFQYAGPGTETDIRLGSLVPVDHYRIDRGIWMAIRNWSRENATGRRGIA